MKRLTMADFAGLTDMEALVLYLTQNRNDTSAAIADMSGDAHGLHTKNLKRHLIDVEKQLSEATARMVMQAGA